MNSDVVRFTVLTAVNMKVTHTRRQIHDNSNLQIFMVDTDTLIQ
jgi:hypothetical protein